MISPASLDYAGPVGAERLFCSWQAGWRSTLVRQYVEPLSAEDFEVAATPDLKIVLVTGGSCEIESHSDGTWTGASYAAGQIGLVAPGEGARLRWRGRERHRTIQLYVPGRTIRGLAKDLYGSPRLEPGLLRQLSLLDPIVASTVLAIDRAARSGAPELYGETAARFLAVHLLARAMGDPSPAKIPPQGAGLRPADDYMRRHLSDEISLADLAKLVGVSRFQLLRMAQQAWGETPMRRLTRLRMDLARSLLARDGSTITDVSLDCGYANPTHFATAFRRHTGLSPSQYRTTVGRND